MKTQNLFYGKGGRVEEETHEDFIYAKRVWNGREYIYLVKYATHGPEAPHLINPWGIHFISSEAGKEIRHLGKKKYEFKKVSPEVFEIFINFLETGKEMYWRHAERQLD